jgi:galactose mutarotase-like enzyme
VASGAELLWTDSTASTEGPLAGDSGSNGFYDRYPGGIQELFPNAGPECEVQGAPLVFHGESCRVAWSIRAVPAANGVALECRGALRRYPFTLLRVISLSPETPDVQIRSSVTNTSAAALPVHWGFHPAFSTELTDAPALLVGEFGSAVAEQEPFSASRRWQPSEAIPLDVRFGFDAIALTPGDAGCADLAYATANAGWCVLRSERSGLSVGLTWPVETFPRLWIWQECRDPAGYPWWGRHHIVGIEPHSSAPSRSLDAEIVAGEAIMIAAGETREALFGIRVMRGDEAAAGEFVRSISQAYEEVQ